MFTVLGDAGFIGSRLTRHLADTGQPWCAPGRGGDAHGHVIYCAGVTHDFRTRPLDTVEAHVCALLALLRAGGCDSITYLSSTRVYARHRAEVAAEDDELRLRPADPDDLYGLSKALGESLLLQAGSGLARVVRLSNVYGDPSAATFLSTILRDAVQHGHVTLHSALDSAQDYVSVADVVALLPRIARSGSAGIYNLASGINVSHEDLLERITALTGASLEVVPDAPTVRPPRICVDRVRSEFGYTPAAVLDDLPRLVGELQAC